ncbi:flavodoxin-dependent (E)-4-hydroxy-3-methylbut-2-enyl-diphosphate synthase [bacterium]|nr:flavodoxin-dependent (E)-4-hydroxy-3-methylbut-2-enyl-diphosphate synthase [bacterium]MBT4251160.1 flavodoxin-dependent (E)-4-hydroxy-3-methylbut-2-enyl-diphosphate synthase [bacterium]MBT4598048.1 flavodoxin-dependent (E)-4-hydroxy-3-methylbut-2-enyl-diphosphate synthase [bacterium]MBT6753391.1 flavodoxin-dependent (E)-4-hydroxy-3-methylbut-2-enyl-diphosphate synthase [bacterium]MBT7038104.1 flavodoxin-dependent (E)-4-hydroxy-3-methylbut-2-enyl-diphosphate synthase [bacterium]
MKRKKTRHILIGNVGVGGDEPVRVQSMTNTDTRNVKKTVSQIKGLERVGCEIVRVAVPDMEAAKVLSEIKKQISIPLVADIHFSADLALEAIRQGVDKIRINPGNVKPIEKIKEVVLACKKKKIPIRIGVNAGSLEQEILEQYKGEATAKGMVQSAIKHITILEELGFEDIMISLKASDIERTVEAYRELSEKVNYPLHVGVTEAGTKFRGTVMSSIGIGTLLYAGIGDTIRVSLTDDPTEEIPVAWEILSALDLRHRKPTVTSCPTCGRTEIDLLKLTKEVEKLVEKFPRKLHIAVMGCIVNGPGEAKEADIAVIGGKGVGLICRKGKILRKVKERDLLTEFKKELEKEFKK